MARRTLATRDVGANSVVGAHLHQMAREDIRRHALLTRRIVTGGLAVGLLGGVSGPRPANRRLELDTALAGEPLTMVSEARFAGAVSSLLYRGIDYVDRSDHGRLFQGAVQYGGLGEALNPTQGGASRDRAASTSRLMVANVGGALWDVTTQAAYWLRPRDRWTPPGEDPQRAANRTRLSDTLITHRHRFGALADPRAVAAEAIFTLAAPQPSVVVEAFTLYAPAAFSVFHSFRDGMLTLDETVESQPGERAWPTVVSTPDGAHAFALVSRAQRPVGYGRGRFPTCSKLNLVFRPPNGLEVGSHSYPAAWTLGTLVEVAATLGALA